MDGAGSAVFGRLAPLVFEVERIKVMGINFGVIARDTSGNIVHYFRRQAQAYRAGFVRSSITKCLKGTNETHRGLKWERACLMDMMPSFIDEHCTSQATAWPARMREVYDAFIASLPEAWRQYGDTYNVPRMGQLYWKVKPTDYGESVP